MNGGIGGDQRAPRGQLPSGPVWSRDGRTILIGVGEQGNANIKRVDVASGKIEPLTTGSSDVMSYTADTGAQKIAFVLSTPTVVGDLHVLDTASPGAAPKKLTTFNDALFGQLTMNEPEEIWYTSFDGRKIQGWILKPPAFDATKKYPFILEIHGGPHAAYGNTFTHEFQWMAAKGYVVLYTNPRGSSNYGQDFGNIIQYNYPGDDYKDLMAGVDEVAEEGLHRRDPARRDRRQRRRTAHQLGGDADDAIQGRRQPARHLGLVELLVHRRLHALHADLVPQGPVRGSGGLREALADHLRREDPDAADVHPRRGGLPDAAGSRRRGSLPRAEVPQAADGHGAVPWREPRAVALGPSLAPRRTPAAHRRLVRQVADGERERDLRGAVRPPGAATRGSGGCRGARPRSANARGHPARRVRPLSRQQRPALLPPRRPRRSGQEVLERKEHGPLQDAAGRHADSARPLREPQGREDCAWRPGAEVRARAERGLHRFSRDAQARARVRDRLSLLGYAARDGPVRRDCVPQGPRRPPLDQYRVRR